MHQCADGASHVRLSGDLSCDFLVLSGMAHLLLKVDYHIKIKAEMRNTPLLESHSPRWQLEMQTLQKNKIKG